MFHQSMLSKKRALNFKASIFIFISIIIVLSHIQSHRLPIQSLCNEYPFPIFMTTQYAEQSPAALQPQHHTQCVETKQYIDVYDQYRLFHLVYYGNITPTNTRHINPLKLYPITNPMLFSIQNFMGSSNRRHSMFTNPTSSNPTTTLNQSKPITIKHQNHTKFKHKNLWFPTLNHFQSLDTSSLSISDSSS